MQAFPAHARFPMLDTHVRVQTHGKPDGSASSPERGLGTRLNLALTIYYQTNKTSNLSSFSGPWPLQVAVQPNGLQISHSMQTADCGIT